MSASIERVVLCSASPRRRDLLRQIGLADFDIRVPNADEHYPEGLDPRGIVEHISDSKAAAARAICSGRELFITADTMVFLDELRLGKPHSADEAFSMLRALSGRSHHVLTGVSVGLGGELITEVESTEVHFRPLSDETIRRYIASGEPMDKAGAYGIQGLGALLVTSIVGDYYNVMGLPLVRLARMLSSFGVTLL